MLDEYKSYLSKIDIDTVFACTNGYVDSDDCSWYHKNWMFLRALGIVSNPFWHEQFFAEQLKRYYKPNHRVLVLGTADFSMPLLLNRYGISQIDICDICPTPLNICNTVAENERFNWKTFSNNIFDGIDGNYDIIVNDAFLTRFEYSQKSNVLNNIKQSLFPNGVYITTVRNGWNQGKLVVPTEKQQIAFIKKAVQTAKIMGIDSASTASVAKTYIENIVSYPLKNEAALGDIADGLLKIVHCQKETVIGEAVETSYFRVVFKRMT